MQTTKISWAFRKLILRWSWIGAKKKLLQDVNFETIKKKNAVVQMGGGSPIMQGFLIILHKIHDPCKFVKMKCFRN